MTKPNVERTMPTSNAISRSNSTLRPLGIDIGENKNFSAIYSQLAGIARSRKSKTQGESGTVYSGSPLPLREVFMKLGDGGAR